MRVFISWSGLRARTVAEALRDWLPDVLQNVRPWMSRHDIGAGARWGHELDEELDSTDFGIACVTPENQEEPWLMYEAGALAKRVTESRVVPYLIGFSKATELLPNRPLTRFQAKLALSETFGVVVELNAALGEREFPMLSETKLRRAYDQWWPRLEDALKTLPPAEAEARRPDLPSMVEEILGTVRDISRGSFGPQATRLELETFGTVQDQIIELLSRINADSRIRSAGISVSGLTPKRTGGWQVNFRSPGVHRGAMSTAVPGGVTEPSGIAEYLAGKIAETLPHMEEARRRHEANKPPKQGA